MAIGRRRGRKPFASSGSDDQTVDAAVDGKPEAESQFAGTAGKFAGNRRPRHLEPVVRDHFPDVVGDLRDVAAQDADCLRTTALEAFVLDDRLGAELVGLALTVPIGASSK